MVSAILIALKDTALLMVNACLSNKTKPHVNSTFTMRNALSSAPQVFTAIQTSACLVLITAQLASGVMAAPYANPLIFYLRGIAELTALLAMY